MSLNSAPLPLNLVKFSRNQLIGSLILLALLLAVALIRLLLYARG